MPLRDILLAIITGCALNAMFSLAAIARALAILASPPGA